MKTYAVGDLHGAYRALVNVFEKVRFDLKKDKLIFLGDLADKWDEADKCLRLLLQIENFVAILGNHDLFLKKWVETGHIDKRWLKIGGAKTMAIFGTDELKDLLIQYFQKAEYFFYEQGYLFCHGGFNQNRPIVEQSRLGFCINRRLYKLAKKYSRIGKKIEAKYDSKNSKKINRIFIGHTPTSNNLPDFKSNLINLDTGVSTGGKGKLTLMNIYNTRFVQSLPISNYYNSSRM